MSISPGYKSECTLPSFQCLSATLLLNGDRWALRPSSLGLTLRWRPSHGVRTLLHPLVLSPCPRGCPERTRGQGGSLSTRGGVIPARLPGPVRGPPWKRTASGLVILRENMSLQTVPSLTEVERVLTTPLYHSFPSPLVQPNPHHSTPYPTDPPVTPPSPITSTRSDRNYTTKPTPIPDPLPSSLMAQSVSSCPVRPPVSGPGRRSRRQSVVKRRGRGGGWRGWGHVGGGCRGPESRGRRPNTLHPSHTPGTLIPTPLSPSDRTSGKSPATHRSPDTRETGVTRWVLTDDPFSSQDLPRKPGPRPDLPPPPLCP